MLLWNWLEAKGLEEVVVAAAVEVEEVEVTEEEDQFGLTSINIDIFFSQFNRLMAQLVLNITA